MLWKQSTWSYGLSSQGLPQFTGLYLRNLLWWNQRLWSNFHYWNDESLESVVVSNRICIFFLSPCSSWGIRDKTCLPGCALRWPCLAFCFQERLSSPAWEESRDEGTSCWSLPQPLSPSPTPSPHRDKGADFKRWHCKMEHGFGFCFLIEYEDEMKKTLVTAGRRLITIFFFSFFFFCRLSKKEPLCLKRYFRNICKITYFVQ